ncbi:MAG: hypothetical protein LBR53_01815 [Deltaproteobacteria bacterium]|jgi:tetratricopeptide (TPR) repeat protein|nr:hypothetical protein [Deltaproteobacteria bacterium]
MTSKPENEIAYLEREVQRFLLEAVKMGFTFIAAPEKTEKRLSRNSKLTFTLLKARNVYETMLLRLEELRLAEDDPQAYERSWRICAAVGGKLAMFYAEIRRYSEALSIFERIPLYRGSLSEHSSSAIASSLIVRHLITQNDLPAAKKVFLRMRPLGRVPNTLYTVARTAYWLFQRYDFLQDLESMAEIYDFLLELTPKEELRRLQPSSFQGLNLSYRERRAPLHLVKPENGRGDPALRAASKPAPAVLPALTLLMSGENAFPDDGAQAEDLREFARIEIKIAERLISVYWHRGRPEDARRVYDAILDLSNPAFISNKLAKSGYRLLSEYVSKGRWAEVEDIYARITPDKTKSFQALKAQAAYELVFHFADEKKLERAVGYYDYIAGLDESLTLQFDQGNALRVVMDHYHRLGLLKAAEKRCFKYLRTRGSLPGQQSSKASCALKLLSFYRESFADERFFRKAEHVFSVIKSLSGALNFDGVMASALVYMLEGALLTDDLDKARGYFRSLESLNAPDGLVPLATSAAALIGKLLELGALLEAADVYRRFDSMEFKEPILRQQFQAADAILDHMEKTGALKIRVNEISGGLLRLPPGSGFLKLQIELATKTLSVQVRGRCFDEATVTYQILMELSNAAGEFLMGKEEMEGLKAKLELSWSESALALIEHYAGLGLHREAHIIFLDLFDLSDNPVLLNNRDKARSIISRFWADSLNP